MTQKNVITISKIILSALLFSIPFLCSSLGFLILFFWIPLVSIKVSFSKGFLWGIVAYGLHFIWLYILLIEKSNIGMGFSFLLYSIIVFYSALTSGLWFMLGGLLRFKYKAISLIISSVLYFFLLDRYMFWFFESGYPFINPIIPLMRYKLFCLFVSSLFYLVGINKSVNVPYFYHMPKSNSVEFNNASHLFLYLAPCTSKSEHECFIEMSERLKSLNLEELSQKYKKIFLIGPETTYPYTFNDKKWLVKRWGELLPDNVHMIFGSGLLNKIRKKTYQTVYWTKESLIMQHYDKTHRVAFTEKIPRFIKKYKRTRVGAWLYKLFEGRAFIGKGRNRPENEIFCLDNDLVIKPILCSELFMKNISKATRNYHLMVAFLNDNWFCGYFRNILLKLARLRGIFFERPLIYVGHA